MLQVLFGSWDLDVLPLALLTPRFKGCKSAFILVHTLAMLSRQRIPKHRVTLFVANESERTAISKADAC